MLGAELSRQDYKKATHNRALDTQIGRGRGAIELKHQNISAVLLGLNETWINGYKPAKNFQLSLIDAVLRWFNDHPQWSPLVLRNQTTSRSPTTVADAEMLWIGPPPTQSNVAPIVELVSLEAIYRKVDVAARDAANRALGRAGEERILLHEQQTLRMARRPDLAERIRWLSDEGDDGAGFDILSFESDGRDRRIEVKTTNGWERSPFHISRNELATADRHRDDWHLIRLYNFARAPRAFSIRPPLERHVELMPTSFMATLR